MFVRALDKAQLLFHAWRALAATLFSVLLTDVQCQARRNSVTARTVPPIKMGFQAQIGKRRAMKG